MNNEQPYIEEKEKVVISKKRVYNPNYGDSRICRCGHSYYRHFDTYEEMSPVGCKYCSCGEFIEAPLNMKRVLICGGSSFIGTHLAKYFKSKGYWVKCAGIRHNEFIADKDYCDEFQLVDLRDSKGCDYLFNRKQPFDEIYQLAADMGGIGYISSFGADMLRNNVLVNANVLNAAAENKFKGKYFFSSSVYIYPKIKDSTIVTEEDAYPAMPDNEYGWEKLYSERMVTAFGKKYGFQTRIARLENIYGENGAWKGGKEKAPAALCRKVAMAKDGEEIEVWGDGTAIRSFAYVKDIVEGIYDLVQSDLDTPVNIGSSEYISVNDLVNIIIKISKKDIKIKHIDGPIGSQSWNFSKEKIKSTGWDCKYSLVDGMTKTYNWILKQVS